MTRKRNFQTECNSGSPKAVAFLKEDQVLFTNNCMDYKHLL